MKTTELITVILGFVFIVLLLLLTHHSDNLQYKTQYGDLITEINPFVKVFLDNQGNISLGLIAISLIIIGSRWQKFIKNMIILKKYLNEFIHKLN